MNILVRGATPVPAACAGSRTCPTRPATSSCSTSESEDGRRRRWPRRPASATPSWCERLTDSRPDDEQLAGLGAYGMAATIDFALEAKQALLEARSEDERMRMIGELFVTTMKRLDLVERANERAQTNGKVRF